jgi:hypothetical protein
MPDLLTNESKMETAEGVVSATPSERSLAFDLHLSREGEGVSNFENAIECAPELAEDMPLNDADKAWVREEIAKATGGIMPPWLKQSLALIVVLGAGGFILQDYVPNKIRGETSDMRSTLSSVSTDVGNIKNDLSGIKSELKDTFNKAIERAYPPAPTPARPKRPGEVGNLIERGNAVIEMANNLGIGLDPAVANRFGLDAISSSENPVLSDAAWKAAEASLRQRSRQDEVIDAIERIHWLKVNIPQPIKYKLDAFFGPIDNYGSEMTATPESAWFSVPMGTEKDLEALRRKFPVPDPEYVRFVGKGQTITPLDGYHFKNVVFENFHIAYHGGPLILENVTFIHCSFDFQNKMSSRSLATALLKGLRVTFKT